MNALTESMVFKWLLPVRGASRFVHYVYRDASAPMAGESLCGQMGALNRYGVPKFRKLTSKGTPGDICNACHAEACKQPTRVDWRS